MGGSWKVTELWDGCMGGSWKARCRWPPALSVAGRSAGLLLRPGCSLHLGHWDPGGRAELHHDRDVLRAVRHGGPHRPPLRPPPPLLLFPLNLFLSSFPPLCCLFCISFPLCSSSGIPASSSLFSSLLFSSLFVFTPPLTFLLTNRSTFLPHHLLWQ